MIEYIILAYVIFTITGFIFNIKYGKKSYITFNTKRFNVLLGVCRINGIQFWIEKDQIFMNFNIGIFPYEYYLTLLRNEK